MPKQKVASDPDGCTSMTGNFSLQHHKIDEKISIDAIALFSENLREFLNRVQGMMVPMAARRFCIPPHSGVCQLGEIKSIAYEGERTFQQMDVVLSKNDEFMEIRSNLSSAIETTKNAVTELEMLMSPEHALEFGSIPEITGIGELQFKYPLRVSVIPKTDTTFQAISMNVPCPYGSGETPEKAVESLQKEFLFYWRSLNEWESMGQAAAESKKQFCRILGLPEPKIEVLNLEVPDDNDVDED